MPQTTQITQARQPTLQHGDSRAQSAKMHVPHRNAKWCRTGNRSNLQTQQQATEEQAWHRNRSWYSPARESPLRREFRTSAGRTAYGPSTRTRCRCTTSMRSSPIKRRANTPGVGRKSPRCGTRNRAKRIMHSSTSRKRACSVSSPRRTSTHCTKKRGIRRARS